MLRSLVGSTVKIIIAVCLIVAVGDVANARTKFHSSTGWTISGGATSNRCEFVGAGTGDFNADTGILTLVCPGLRVTKCWELDGNDIWVYGVIGAGGGSTGTVDYAQTTGDVTITVE